MSPYIRWCCFLFFLTLPCHLVASPNCDTWMAKVVSSQGRVDYQPSELFEWHQAASGHTFCNGDKVRTGRNSRATLMLSNGSTFTLDQNSTLVFLEPERKKSNWLLKIFSGSVFFRSRVPQKLNIRTPFINAVHEGTEFLVAVDSEKTKISVFDGIVAAENEAGKIRIQKGFTGIASKDRPPQLQALTIRPEDAVQWTLYYPPIIDYREWGADASALHTVLKAYDNGDLENAFNKLEDIAVESRDNRYWTFKASMLLTVGRVTEASLAIEELTVNQSGNSSALALQSVIAVTKNQQDKALTLAEKAVQLDFQSAAAFLALSYARQSRQEIKEALQATQEAVRLSPENALAWARLSELHLSLGDYDRAMDAARKARDLNPNLAKIETVLGFAELAQIDIDQAKTTFERAVELDAGDPTARLGLGLTKIRQGDVKEGTRDLETAVSLDPNNAVARSYLGKAYYELRNADYAETELGIAKEMDPKDPTPWFYDAILKQSENRPVEALHDMQEAIELNDNRGVYRSRLLLDEDAAARTANLARVYNDLGFGRVALKEAWKSLGYDSTNHSAHRFLADSYLGQPRFRIARASELLQSQLLQPINIIPVQPQLTSENIGILNSLGPTSLSSNEYDPMFTSNGAHVVLNGAYGSNNTLTDNAIVSGVYDNLSLSMGQFHFQTDGFRLNDDYQQDVYDAFAQYSFNQDLSIQFEFKSDDVRSGDVPFRLNEYHQENLRQTIEHDTARVGGHYRIDSEQDLIVSAFYTTRKTIVRNHVFDTEDPDPFFHFNTQKEIAGEDKGYQAEAQYLFHQENFDITAGFGYLGLTSNSFIENVARWTEPPITIISDPRFTNFSKSRRETDYFNAYIYSNQNILPGLTTTLGLSFDYFENDIIKRVRLNPKFGIIWNPIQDLTVRGAVLRNLNRPLAAGQTIETTQVAGFNQFFDGINGAMNWQYSLGMDYALAKNIMFGGELNWRKILEPLRGNNSPDERDKDEVAHLAYLYWTPVDWLALKSEYRYHKISRDFIVNQGSLDEPQSVITDQVPLSLNFFHGSGMFAKFSGTFVNQKVVTVRDLNGQPVGTDPLERQKDNFWVFDTSVGYRLPKKIGLISFEVRNLFDNGFKYQSTFDASGPQLTPFVPEREFFIKLSLFY